MKLLQCIHYMNCRTQCVVVKNNFKIIFRNCRYKQNLLWFNNMLILIHILFLSRDLEVRKLVASVWPHLNILIKNIVGLMTKFIINCLVVLSQSQHKTAFICCLKLILMSFFVKSRKIEKIDDVIMTSLLIWLKWKFLNSHFISMRKSCSNLHLLSQTSKEMREKRGVN